MAPKLCTHDGTEDGSCTSNIQKLNHENLPVRKGNKVNPVGFCYSGSNTIVGTKHVGNKTTIKQIT